MTVPPDVTQSALFAEAAREARQESRSYWHDNDEKHPVQKHARFWPMAKPRDPEGVLFLNARGVRVLCAVLELIEFRDLEAIESLINREITRAPECQ